MTVDEKIAQLKTQRSITRTDIEELFELIGAPGEERLQKADAMRALNKKNNQGIDVSETADTYRGW